MARKKRKAATRSTAASTQAGTIAEQPRLPEWRWRTFPVVFAFFVGLLVASLVNPPSSDFGYGLQIVALLGVGYCIGHMIVTNVVVAGRQRRARDRSRDGGAWVDEVVHPDEAAPPKA